METVVVNGNDIPESREKRDALRVGKELGLGNGYRPKTVIEVIEKKCGISFRKISEQFVYQHSEEIGIPAGRLRVLSCYYRWIKSVLEQKMSDIRMDLIYRNEVKDCESGRRKTVWVAIRTDLDLRPCHQYLTEISPRFYDWNEKDGLFDHPEAIKLNAYLLPYIRNAAYSKIVMRILDELYPENLDQSDEPVSGEKFVHAMGLEDVTFPFPHGAGEGEMGRMQFMPAILTVEKDDGTEADYMLGSGTVLLNSRTCRSRKDRNETYFHECAHFLLDRFFYFLQMMGGAGKFYAFGRSPEVIEAEKRESEIGRYLDKSGWTPIDWSEYHAEKFQIYAILNEKQTKRFADRTITELGGVRTPAVMETCITRIAEHFDVSKMEAKIRLIELGYPEARGAYNFDRNRNHLRNISCSSWDDDSLTTYCIEEDDLAEIISQDKNLAEIMAGGRYQYVDHYLCLRDPKYLWWDGNTWQMTDYAYDHVDECCIAFRVRRVGPADSSDTMYHSQPDGMAYAARRPKVPVTSSYLSAPEFKKEPTAAEWEMENNKAAKDAVRWGELEAQLPSDFHDALGMIMDAKGLTQEEIGFRLGVSKAMISKVANSSRPALSHVVGICMAIGMPYYIAEDLVDLSGNRLNPVGIRRLYKNFLACPNEYSIERCNAILVKNGFQPFFNAGDQ